jgi:hypothetical protein
MNDEAIAGDRILQKNSDGTFDILKIEGGQRECVRSHISTQQQAREIARGSLDSGGRIWLCNEDSPDVLEAW